MPQPATHLRASSGHRGFTLIEALVTAAIVAVLVAIVLPTASRTLAAARGFACQSDLRTVAFDFAIAADSTMSGQTLTADGSGRPGFSLDSFQDNEYGVGRFWSHGAASSVVRPGDAQDDPMRCSEVAGPLVVQRDVPCVAGGVGPPQNVSYGFNARLRYNERAFGQQRNVRLTDAVLRDPNAPLVLDVDGAHAANTGQLPFYTAPALDSPAMFAANRLWFPARRHNGKINVAFIGGHVLSTGQPLEDSSWLWDPRAGK